MADAASLEIALTISGQASEPGFSRLRTVVRGSVRGRIAQFDAPLSGLGTREVARLGAVTGLPILVVVNRDAVATPRSMLVGNDQISYAQATSPAYPVLAPGKTLTEPEAASVYIGAPVLMLESESEHGSPGGDGHLVAMVTSAPWWTDDMTIFLQEGNFRVYLLELEPGSITVETERS